MRVKDENKRLAIRQAVVQVVNDLGLEGASVSKIAQVAEVSAASIYTYYDDKDAMLASIYQELKGEMWAATMGALDPSAGPRELFRKGWLTHYRYIVGNPADFRFIEQASNSSALSSAESESATDQHAALYGLYAQGRQQGVLRDLPDSVISAYLFGPLTHLAKQELSGRYQPTEHVLEEAFAAAWRSVALE